jgi:hypothetical protein
LNTATNDVYKKTTSWGIIMNIKGLTGDPGAPGTDGYTWYSGSTVPDNGDGVNGDFYLRTTTSDVYKKAAGTWSIIVNIKGLAGDTGPKGDTGDPGSSSFDVSYYRHYGTTPYESWYTSPRAGTALAGSALAANRMYAMPFISPKAITIDQIGVYVSTLSTTTARLGIYNDNGNCYPGTLLLDAGTIDVTATGAKKIAINQVLGTNKLYWFVIVCAATPSIYCIPVAAVISILGTSSALGTAQYAGLYVSQTYGALPGTFPASPTMITAAPIPCIWIRLSG